MENHTKYQDSIYFRSADDATLYVNLYIPSTLRWAERGLTVTQSGAFPTAGRTHADCRWPRPRRPAAAGPLVVDRRLQRAHQRSPAPCEGRA